MYFIETLATTVDDGVREKAEQMLTMMAGSFAAAPEGVHIHWMRGFRCKADGLDTLREMLRAGALPRCWRGTKDTQGAVFEDCPWVIWLRAEPEAYSEAQPPQYVAAHELCHVMDLHLGMEPSERRAHDMAWLVTQADQRGEYVPDFLANFATSMALDGGRSAVTMLAGLASDGSASSRT